MARRRVISKKTKIALIFGTRPEVIKLYPLIQEFSKCKNLYNVKIITTGQHKDLSNQIINKLKIKVDISLNVMKKNQTLFYLTSKILTKLEKVLIDYKPDMVIVHGDTPSAFAGALSAYYLKLPVAHVEAGLRSGLKHNPYPEEMNRKLIDNLSDIYFAPTLSNAKNLYMEGVSKEKVTITGNTSIDMLRMLDLKNNNKLGKVKKILLTCHRRESWGDKMVEIFTGIKMAIDELENVEVVFPVHTNPVVKKVAYKYFSKNKKFKLIKPVDHLNFVKMLNESHLVITDSGGIQEEANFLNKKMVIIRDVTERQEILKNKSIILSGTSSLGIKKAIIKLIKSDNLENKNKLIYGDGFASKKILAGINKYFNYE